MSTWKTYHNEECYDKNIKHNKQKDSEQDKIEYAKINYGTDFKDLKLPQQEQRVN